MGDYKSPGFHRSNLFFKADCKSAGTPRGRLFSGRLAEAFASIPLGVSTDLQSVV